MEREPKVVVVHDYLTQRGGAERVVIEMLRAFPGARLVTSCWNPSSTFEEFFDYDIETLWPDKVPPFRRDPRKAFPVLAGAFARHRIEDADIVLCSSSGWAHRVASTAPRLVYCYNPARWLYQPADYFASWPAWVQDRFPRWTTRLQRSDAEAARSATAYLVTSSVVADRVEARYGIVPTVLPPPRGLSPEGPQDPIPGVEPGFLLTVSRDRGYKHVDRIIQAVERMPEERLVVVGGADATSSARVRTLRNVSDAGLRWLYSQAGAVVAMAHEDFGLTPVEAQAHGTPTLALRGGGYLDTTIEGETGLFVESSTTEDIIAGIRATRAHDWDRDILRKWGDRYSPETFRKQLRSAVGDVLAGRSIRLVAES